MSRMVSPDGKMCDSENNTKSSIESSSRKCPLKQ